MRWRETDTIKMERKKNGKINKYTPEKHII